MPKVIYCGFFNETILLRDALAMDASKIISLFQGFVDNVNPKVRVQEEARDYIGKAVLMIKIIHERYVETPNQNPGYIEEPEPKSERKRVGSLKVGYQGNEFELRTLYDIVGWIFSVVGDVPDRATVDNYYYALMIIAYAFCTKLVDTTIHHKGPPEKIPINLKVPIVWMVMWFEQMVDKKPVKRVVLGATLDDPEPPVIKNVTKEFRKVLLENAGIVRDGMTSMRNPQDSRGQDFGNCAESYPLLFICSLATGLEASEIRKSANGISATVPGLYHANHCSITGYYRPKDGTVINGILRPCDNCNTLMKGNGFKLANFEKGLTWLGGKPGAK